MGIEQDVRKTWVSNERVTAVWQSRLAIMWPARWSGRAQRVCLQSMIQAVRKPVTRATPGAWASSLTAMRALRSARAPRSVRHARPATSWEASTPRASGWRKNRRAGASTDRIAGRSCVACRRPVFARGLADVTELTVISGPPVALREALAARVSRSCAQPIRSSRSRSWSALRCSGRSFSAGWRPGSARTRTCGS